MLEIREKLAKARINLRSAKDAYELARAKAEQQAVSTGKADGKNAEERARALTVALSEDTGYITARTALRTCEAEVDRQEAALEGARDARRYDEWTIRAQLVDALNRMHVPSGHDDRAGEGAFDDVADQRQVGMLETALRSRSEGAMLAERGRLNGRQRQGQTEEDVHWQQHVGTYDRGTEEFEELPF